MRPQRLHRIPDFQRTQLACALPFVSQKMIHGSQQKCAKAAPFAIGLSQPIVLQQAQEELLGQILGIFGIVAATAHVGVEGIPIDLTEPGKRIPGTSSIVAICGKDNRPMSGNESSSLGDARRQRKRCRAAG